MLHKGTCWDSTIIIDQIWSWLFLVNVITQIWAVTILGKWCHCYPHAFAYRARDSGPCKQICHWWQQLLEMQQVLAAPLGTFWQQKTVRIVDLYLLEGNGVSIHFNGKIKQVYGEEKHKSKGIYEMREKKKSLEKGARKQWRNIRPLEHVGE